MTRNFVGIRIVSVAGKIHFIGTSAGRALADPSNAIGSKRAIDFLWSLHTLGKRKDYRNPVFVTYSADLNVERMLAGLPRAVKDILFPSPKVEQTKIYLRGKIRGNEKLIKNYQRLYAATLPEGRLSARARRGVFRSAQGARQTALQTRVEIEDATRDYRKQLAALESVTWRGYRLRVRSGKSLSIYKLESDGKTRHGLTVYDLRHFFQKKPLGEAAEKYLKACPVELIEETDRETLPVDVEERGAVFQDIARRSEIETGIIVRLGEKLVSYLSEVGLSLRKWHGASAAVNALLNLWGVRREFRRVTPDNTPRALLHAIECAFFGGRIETLYLGMIPGVYTYDINSAFAWAVTLLPKLTSGWRYTREYNINAPFALWHVEFQLPPGTRVGLLPFRGGGIRYPRAGSGWYYSPEVRELARAYPGCFRVREGYIVPYSPVTFGDKVRELYDHRLALIAREGKGVGEKIFKDILQKIYGKFCQTVGEAPFYCLPWAAWVTSFVRAMMLEAVRGMEQHIIYFHTDCIHSLKPLPVPRVSEALGDWKSDYYPYGFYVDSGVHCFYDEEGKVIKSATRGFETIDFDNVREQLNDPANFGAMTLKREFWAGWQFACNFPTRGRYLQRIEETLTRNPKNTRARRFPLARFDWSTGYIDSRIVEGSIRKESQPRTELTRSEYYMIESGRR